MPTSARGAPTLIGFSCSIVSSINPANSNHNAGRSVINICAGLLQMESGLNAGQTASAGSQEAP